MIKKYIFNYDFGKASAEFEIDLDKFTDKHAKDTLTFFAWNYNKENNPIDEVMKKYAIECIKTATFEGLSKQGVINGFKNKEGFYDIDGRFGIKLTYIEGLDINEDLLSYEQH